MRIDHFRIRYEALKFPRSSRHLAGVASNLWLFGGFTAPLKNMWTHEFKAQPTNALLTTGGSSKRPTTAEHCFVNIVWTVHNDLINYRVQ